MLVEKEGSVFNGIINLCRLILLIEMVSISPHPLTTLLKGLVAANRQRLNGKACLGLSTKKEVNVGIQYISRFAIAGDRSRVNDAGIE